MADGMIYCDGRYSGQTITLEPRPVRPSRERGLFFGSNGFL